MANVYISFLGTSDYLPCTYFREDREFENLRFVQEATIQLCCRNWTGLDRILIFTTDEAHEKNWLDNGHKDREGHSIERAGLKRSLLRLNLSPGMEEVRVPSGRSEQEIWDIFQILYDKLGEGDRLFFDITHAFRSIPMLAMVVIHYAKVLKSLKLEKVFYGAFEVAGSPAEVQRMPLNERRAPLFDLTPLDSLLDWSLAVDRFLGAGDASGVSMLAEVALRPMLRATGGQDRAAAAVSNVAKNVKALSEVMSTCRGCEISKIAGSLKKNIDGCERVGLLPPFKPLLGRIKESLERFTGNDPVPVGDGLCAAKWCLDHNLIQQGYTILLEVLVNYVALSAGADVKDRKQRELVTHTAGLFARGTPVEAWTGYALNNRALTENYLDIYGRQPALPGLVAELANLRNDLDHAGFRSNPKRPGHFGKRLGELIGSAEKEIVAN